MNFELWIMNYEWRGERKSTFMLQSSSEICNTKNS